MRLTVHINQHPITRVFGQFKTEYEHTGKSRPTNNGSASNKLGLPDTIKGVQENKVKDFVFLSERMQKWMHKLCWERVPSMSESEAKLSWKSLMNGGGGQEGSQMSARAFSDYKGTETNADYINGANLDKDPVAMKSILTGGAWVEIIKYMRINGVEVVKIAAIDPLSEFEQLNPSTHPWLFFYPTISRREKVIEGKDNKFNGRFIENLSIPFPQYKDRAVLPIWAQPGTDYVYMPADRLIERLSPVNPFRGSSYAYPNPYEGLL